MSTKDARNLLLSALGSPQEDDPAAALNIILEGLKAEAEMLTGDETEAFPFSHLYRITALQEFVDQYMVVSWREATEERATKADSKQGLRVVPPGDLQ